MSESETERVRGQSTKDWLAEYSYKEPTWDTKEISMSEYDNKGQVSLWSNREGLAKNERAPRWKGNIIAHRDIKAGEQIDVGLWPNDSTNPNAPVMKGKLQDKFVPEGQAADPPFGSPDNEPPF